MAQQVNRDALGTILGFMSGIICLILGILWPLEYSNLALILGERLESDDFMITTLLKFTRFFDVRSVFIVFGGTFSVTFVAFPLKKTLRCFSSVGKVLAADRSEFEAEDLFEQARKISEKRFNGKRITNDDLNSISNPMFHRLIENLVIREQIPEEQLAIILRAEIEMYDHRAEEEIEILDFMSVAAPAFGMTGTVVGLVLMLAETGSIRAVMQSMSVAMLTTLYGVILANLVLIPLASKRKRLKESNQVLMEMIRVGVQSIAKRESPYTLLQELALYLPSKRDEFKSHYE